MKFRIVFVICFIFLLSCKNDEKLTFETVQMTSNSCAECPKVDISIPKVLENSKIGRTIETALQEEIIFLLTFDEEVDAKTIEEAIQSFNKGYTDLKELYSDESVGWEANIAGKVTFEDQNRLTILLDSYIFTGGAHGYSGKRFLNFNKKKGKELEPWEIFKNMPEFEIFAEEKFREQENIASDRAINSTGFMFENDEFHLPENIGFTEKGLQLLYNQYEVASYSDGPIIMILSYNDINEFLNTKVKS